MSLTNLRRIESKLTLLKKKEKLYEDFSEIFVPQNVKKILRENIFVCLFFWK